MTSPHFQSVRRVCAIVFAKNSEHAEFIAERFNANYPHYKGEFARVMTTRRPMCSP